MSSRALGAMVKGMGGAKFDELLNWLMETLKCEQSSVDRSGAAQGECRVHLCLLEQVLQFRMNLNFSFYLENFLHSFLEVKDKSLSL